MANLGAMRARIDQQTVAADESFAWFTGTIARLLDLAAAATADVEAPEVAKSISVYLSFLRATELAGQERGTGAVGFGAGRFDAARLRRMATLRDNQELYFSIVADEATPAQAEFLRATVVGDAVDTVARMRTLAAEKGVAGDLGGVTGADWFKAATARIDLLKTVEDRLANDLTTLAAGIRDAAQTAFSITSAAVVALLGLTTLVGALMIRAILRPLGYLIRTMRRLAEGETDLVVSHAGRGDELAAWRERSRCFAIRRSRTMVSPRQRERASPSGGGKGRRPACHGGHDRSRDNQSPDARRRTHSGDGGDGERDERLGEPHRPVGAERLRRGVSCAVQRADGGERGRGAERLGFGRFPVRSATRPRWWHAPSPPATKPAPRSTSWMPR